MVASRAADRRRSFPARAIRSSSRPSSSGRRVEESLEVPAEIRTWNEDEEPLKLVADFLTERRRRRRSRSASRRPTASSSSTGCGSSCRGVRDRQRQPGRPRAADDQVAGRARADAGGSGHHASPPIALCRSADPRGHDARRHRRDDRRRDQQALGGTTTAALILIGEASAYPHGTGKPQQSCKRGEIVLLDCTCSVHGYQADISRTFVFGADPTRRAAQGLGPGPSRPADRDGGREGRRARRQRR